MRLLIVSAQGACRGLMAAVMARAMAPRGVEVTLAARAPAAPDAAAIASLRSVGLDAASASPIRLEDAGAADTVVVVGGDLSGGALDWRIDSPGDVGEVLLARERLRERLSAFFLRLEP